MRSSMPRIKYAETIGYIQSMEPSVFPEDHKIISGAREYPGHSGSDYNSPSKTIKAGAHGVPGGENMIRFPDGTLRYMTVHEAKLIQTFPADYVICGSWGEAMRQIGNAVPVLLAEKMGRSVLNALGEVNTVATNYRSHKPRMEQLRLAIEKKRGYKGATASKAQPANSSKRKTGMKRPKSIRAKYKRS